MTGERSDEASVLDVVAEVLTAFRHISGETREVAKRALTAMAEKKPPSPRLSLSIRCREGDYLTVIISSRRGG